MKTTWTKYVTRRLSVQMSQAWNFGFGQPSKKTFGIGIMNTLVTRDSKKTEYYVSTKQFKTYIEDLHSLLGKQAFLKNFHREAQAELKKIFNHVRQNLSVNLNTLSDPEFLEIYSKVILPSQSQFYVYMWTVFNIGDLALSGVVENKLRKYIKNGQELVHSFLKLSSPFTPNDAVLQRKDLLRLALHKNKLSKEQFTEELTKHTNRYQHIPMYDIDHTPYSQEHFLKELRQIKNAENELGKLTGDLKKRKRDYKKILRKLKPDRKFKNLLEFLKQNVYLRDYRDSLRQKQNLELKKFYIEAAKRLGLSLEQILNLTNKEIANSLKTHQHFPLSEARKRGRAFLLIQQGSRVKIYSGNLALNKTKSILKLGAYKNHGQLSGQVGCTGKAKGVAKIVFTNKDLHKVKSGDILIAPMTRQDFVPYIRKAAALVTDEGAVTGHSAIIARELGIPCLVGTKHATLMFKDGDYIEVDADKGIVRKL